MEIEIKAKVEDKAKLRQALIRIGAKEEKNKHQIDEYYNHPSRDTRKTNEYLRLRFNNGESKGIFAYHINLSDGVNKEFEVSVDSIETFRQILKGLNFILLGIIDKRRTEFKFEEFKISIDEVKNIDNFIEVEVDGEEAEIAAKKESCLGMLDKLGISRDKICKKIWLCDIATGRIKYP